MKKTITGGSLNKILDIVYGMMIMFRIAFFALLTMGIINMVRSNCGRASLFLLIASVLGGIGEPALAGAVRAAQKNIAEQTARMKENE